MIQHGHHVFVESHAGVESGFTDGDYATAGATLVQQAADVWSQADLIIKVKEPLPLNTGIFDQD